MPLRLRHQTGAEFMQRFRRRFRQAEREEAARLAARLYDWFAAGDITQVQIRQAFGLDTTEKWTTFRDRIMALRDHWGAIQSARGE